MTPSRAALLADLRDESRRYVASYVLFNQAIADHLGLHPTDVQCLNLLSLEPGSVTTGQIAELTGLTSGSATRLVDRLVKAGYVRRERDAQDRRRVLVQLDPAAMARFGALWRELAVDWDALFDQDTEAELALLIRHMRRTTALGRRQVARLAARGPAAGIEH
ncbi:MarR family winged helix-turn-helix transcriptional regulator [Kitasatospora sp. NPDC006697]|uniref:MarR family winged helix-turn-helix transcriptional regulator n=1 Tax=Kitasatospora sp. NPDC006697 TaxID=3364020 RepID=UPI0036AF8038